MQSHRVILHVDMDAFFAAVEQRDHPAWRSRPVLVGHDGARGVVAAASYEARRFGCHSAQPMAIAKIRCPQAIIVRGRYAHYRALSRTIFNTLETFTDLIEPISIDEAFLDVTGSQRLFGPPRTIAHLIKQRVKEQTGLTASVGVASNKFLAKLASDLKKPDGLVVIEPDQVDAVLLPLAVTKIWGLGPAAARRFETLGVHTIAGLRKLPVEQLTDHFGSAGERYHRLAHGLDNRAVTPDRQAKSIGAENTFGVDVSEGEHVRQVLLGHVESVAGRLRRHQFKAARVSIKIRYGDFQTITRSTTLDEPTDTTQRLWEAAAALFDQWAAPSFKPVRLIGMTAYDWGRGETQLALFANQGARRQARLDAVTDAITAKYGNRSIHRGLLANQGRVSSDGPDPSGNR